jgi:O-antigen/teichoic acid export membrane protein
LVVPLLFTTFTDAFFLICEVLEKKEIVLRASVFALYNLVMDIILIPIYGIMGAAVATGSASVFLYLYVWATFRYSLKMDIGFPFAAGTRILVNTAVMAVITALFLRYVDSAVMVIAAAVLGAVVYVISSYFNKAFSEDERRLINENLGRQWFVF